MRRNDSFVLERLEGVPYLMPFGQAMADVERGIQLNETGAFLWELLAQEHSWQELIQACAEHYKAAREELSSLEADVNVFCTGLRHRGLLLDSESSGASLQESFIVAIAGLNLRLNGPGEAFSHEFDSFRIVPVSEASLAIHQDITLYHGHPLRRKRGELLLHNGELVVMDCEDEYVLLFPAAPKILEARLTKDGSKVDFYCQPPFTDAFRQDLFHAIRLPFLYLLKQRGMTVIHSASLLYEGRAWLFSGPSGTGKSTHTGLWQRLLGTPFINGDLNLVAVENGKPVVHGLPWCGTSGICDVHTYPLGGIILLKQAPEDHIEELSLDRKLLLVQQRMITPSWTKKMLEQNLEIAKQLIPHILVCRLHCTISDNAVEVIREQIDRFLKAPSTP